MKVDVTLLSPAAPDTTVQLRVGTIVQTHRIDTDRTTVVLGRINLPDERSAGSRRSRAAPARLAFAVRRIR
jgi:hypothetical protein